MEEFLRVGTAVVLGHTWGCVDHETGEPRPQYLRVTALLLMTHQQVVARTKQIGLLNAVQGHEYDGMSAMQ